MDVEAYEAGTPSWVDVTGPEVEVLTDFYTQLFGWEAEDQGPEAGHYTMFSQRGRSVAAASPTPPNMTGAPPSWTTYVTVADVDSSVAAISGAGGTVVMEPMDVFDSGRMAVATDPSGGLFAIWQAGEHIGAEIVNEPVSLCWNELTCRNADDVLEFYSAVFGWRVNRIGTEADAPFQYRELYLGDKLVGGCMEMDDSWPEGIPTHWMTYFAVDNADDTARRAAELGGAVPVEPFDLPVGRTAVLNDPAGSVFSVIGLSENR